MKPDKETVLKSIIQCMGTDTDYCANCPLSVDEGNSCHREQIWTEYAKNELKKEPAASVENCTDSSEDVSISSFPSFNDITNSKKCQVISGAQMFEFLAAMLVQRLEKGFVITEIEAYGLSCEMKFKYGDEVYGLTFTNETRADDVD